MFNEPSHLKATDYSSLRVSGPSSWQEEFALSTRVLSREQLEPYTRSAQQL